MSFTMNEKPMAYPRPDAPRRVEGIVFHLALNDVWIETIGTPFEYRGRVWAVHRSPQPAGDDYPRYTVSDVETGRSFRRLLEPTIEAARAAAIGVISTMPAPVWSKLVRARDHARVAA